LRRAPARNRRRSKYPFHGPAHGRPGHFFHIAADFSGILDDALHRPSGHQAHIGTDFRSAFDRPLDGLSHHGDHISSDIADSHDYPLGHAFGA
jgi:hypothetical protein